MRIALAPVTLLMLAATASAQVMPSEVNHRVALQHFCQGQDWLAVERWERAATEFRAAIRLNPLFTDAHYGLGRAQMGLQRYTSAAQAFQACLEAERKLHALHDKGRLASDHQTLAQINEMRETLRRRGDQDLRPRLSASFEPPAPVLLALGSAHFHNGDRGRAEFYWREAARIDSSLGEAWNNLAVIYARSARRNEAQHALRQAERAGFRVNPGLRRDIAALTP